MNKIKKLMYLPIALLLGSCVCCATACQNDTPQSEKLTDYQKIVNYVKNEGTNNIVLIEGTDTKPIDNVKIELVGNFIRLHLGDGNYIPKNEVSVMLELDLKEDSRFYNYEADYWFDSTSGDTLYSAEGKVEAETFNGNNLTYETYGLKRPTDTTMRVFASQMYYMINTARNHLLTAINVDIAIVFGFDEFL